MVGRVYSSLEKRGKIVAMHQMGASPFEIAAQLDLSVSQVYRWIKRERDQENVRPLATRPKTGRRRILQDVDLQNIEEICENRPFTSTLSIKNELNLMCSRHAIGIHLHKMGIHNRRPAKKIALTPEHRRRRVEFAEQNLNRNWRTTENTVTVFLDEKVFCSDEDGLRLKPLWRRNNTRYEERNVLSVRRSGRISCGFWGWISDDCVGELINIGGRLNGQEYVRILRDVLIPSIDAIYGPEVQILIIQDNCSVHNCRAVGDFVDEVGRLLILPWPAKSPDLNPIENVWGFMVRRWGERRQIRTAEHLINNAYSVWDDLRTLRNYCGQLIGSMTRRLQMVIESQGHPIKY